MITNKIVYVIYYIFFLKYIYNRIPVIINISFKKCINLIVTHERKCMKRRNNESQ